jgi:hypothetical protein
MQKLKAQIPAPSRHQTVGDVIRHLPTFTNKECEEWDRFEALLIDPQPQERDFNPILDLDSDAP